MVSPIADQLKIIFKKYWWGREGLKIETETVRIISVRGKVDRDIGNGGSKSWLGLFVQTKKVEQKCW